MTWQMNDQHKPNHNSYALYYHIVFVTHKREPLISRELADFLEQFFCDKCEELEVVIVHETMERCLQADIHAKGLLIGV